VLGRPVEVADVSADEQSAILASAGLDDGLIGFLVATDASIARGELALATGDLSALIGRPTTPIVETFRAAV
jgi:NAD(P)H dehydrogenase (quinone)